MPQKQKEQEITVEAELLVTYKNGLPTKVRRFEAAWSKAKYLAHEPGNLPVRVEFLGFVRKQ